MTVDFRIEKNVAYVTIDRPERLNAMDTETEVELTRIWDEIEQNTSLRAAVLTGAGDRAFCVGSDMKSGAGTDPLQYWAMNRPGGYAGISLRETLDIPIVARVNGYALGGGLEIVLGCDIVIASTNSTFGLPEPRVGRLALAGGIAHLPRRIPHALAMGMLLTGRPITAQQALDFGLINEVAESSALDSTVDKWIEDIVACAPSTVRAMKQMIRAGEGVRAVEAQRLRIPALIDSLQSDEADEGVRAFNEKRKPSWAQ